ncbi:hypothetical protein BpHYR1_049416 [Brachionus plicatilis]|uniref:Uncharacterized protein n=1 Tax=Brachionus plicatilis TaxID=10195 RepID=A0A3M7PCA0_BRAPC|nr:hypothetical protein BpHYR1_049416 [Brachionus plicatilis]
MNFSKNVSSHWINLNFLKIKIQRV